MKVAFLDRDGTIVRDYLDNVWASVTTLEFLPRSIEALKLIINNGYQIIIVTNQYIINDGIISNAQFHRLHQQFVKRLDQKGVPILDTFYCPHTDAQRCNCKKPKPGLILQALNKYPTIEMEKSFLIGDSKVDILLASHFGLESYFISSQCFNDCCCTYVTSLYDAVRLKFDIK